MAEDDSFEDGSVEAAQVEGARAEVVLTEDVLAEDDPVEGDLVEDARAEDDLVEDDLVEDNLAVVVLIEVDLAEGTRVEGVLDDRLAVAVAVVVYRVGIADPLAFADVEEPHPGCLGPAEALSGHEPAADDSYSRRACSQAGRRQHHSLPWTRPLRIKR